MLTTFKDGYIYNPIQNTRKIINKNELLQHLETGWVKGMGLKIPRETRTCLCGCGIEFVCKISSKKLYQRGHNQKVVKHEK